MTVEQLIKELSLYDKSLIVCRGDSEFGGFTITDIFEKSGKEAEFYQENPEWGKPRGTINKILVLN